MNEILNPYIAGAPVVETSMFFGREAVFSWIERSLAGKYVDHILVLHGQRRVGKTSVLKQIPNFLPNQYIQVFFDLQGRTNTSLDRFLWWLAREIARTLKQERGISIPRPDRADFSADPEYLVNEFLPGLKPLLGDQVLLLTFDEFDTLDRPEIQETLARPLIETLRQMMEIDWLNFIFSIGSSGDKLENMQASYTDFFKSALYRKISFLTPDDCTRLITKPVAGVIQYERKAVSKITEITSGHPYFTQLMCHELFSLCQKTGARQIRATDVDSVLEDVIERGTVNLKFVWDEASDLEKWILAGLAQMDGGSRTAQVLGVLLRQQRVRFSESDLNAALIHLRDKDVITQDNRFIIYLLRMWLGANRPMDRVREELVEVNPIANRYIEIGDEYRDLGQSQEALDSYQQALNVDPDNLKAQSNIAAVHLESNAYQEAAGAFSLALQIDDEDVVSKAGYCDAHLALGDQARDNGEIEAAIGYYRKILVINPAHTDARQRLADIHTARAEAHLTAGEDEQALSAFNQAMDFTPEDDVLMARYEGVLADKKAKATASWLAKADRALTRQQWDKAAEMVSEALALDPDNPALQMKIFEVKDAPRQYKIKAYKTEAEKAIAKGDFEVAIPAIETAVQLAPGDTGLADWLESTKKNQVNARLNLFRDQAEAAITAGDWEAAIAARKAAIKVSPDDPILQKALTDTETAKIHGQLDDLQNQADDAVRRGDWDDAIAALRKAIQVAPGDPVWQTRLEETQVAKIKAQLDAFQAQSEEAISQGDWEAAIQAVQGAIKLVPDDAIWTGKLAEIESARHQAKLEILRGDADQARAAGEWDAAIATLEKIQQLEPDAVEIQTEIAAIRDEKRQQQLGAFKSQAENAIADENWDTAVQAWESYLALEPDDRAEAAEQYQHARKYARISQDYKDAQQAIRKKRYGRAIELLQGIIAQEPAYKSTSRLLVEAVEANKAVPLWRRPWLYWSLGALVVVTLGVAFGPRLWDTISAALKPPQTGEAVTDGEPSIEPGVSLAPEEESQLVDILAYIAETAPTFEDNFSTPKEYWKDVNLNWVATLSEAVSDGVFKIMIQGEEPQSEGIRLEEISGRDFLLQFDFTPVEVVDRAFIQVRWHLDEENGYQFRLFIDGFWDINLLHDEVGVTLAHGIKPVATNQVHTIQVIALGDQMAVYLDSELLATAEDDTQTGEVTEISAHAMDIFQVDIDNLKFWNLERVGVGTQEEEAQAFYQPILAYITRTAPDFTEDFSTPQDYWGNLFLIDNDQVQIALSDTIEDGALRLVDDEPNNYYDFRPDQISGENFALQFDFMSDGTGRDTRVSLIFRGSQADHSYMFETQMNGYWRILETGPGADEHLLQEGNVSLDSNRFYSLMLIVVDDQFAIYLDDKPLAVIGDATLSGEEIGLSVSPNLYTYLTSSKLQVEIDNVRFWNLDGPNVEELDVSTGGEPTQAPNETIEPEPEEPSTSQAEDTQSISERFLEYIVQTRPSFEDDFSTPDEVWGLTSEFLPIHDDTHVFGGELTITDHVDPNSGNSAVDHGLPGVSFPYGNELFKAENFALQFDFSFIIMGSPVDEIGVRFRTPYNQNTGYLINFLRSSGNWTLTRDDGAVSISEGRSSFRPLYNSLLLMVIDQNLFVILNDELIHAANDLDSIGVFTEITVLGKQGSKVKFDNVKFWNLDGMEFSSSIVEAPAVEDLLYSKTVFQGTFTDLDWGANGLIAAIGDESKAVILDALTGEISKDFSDPEQVFRTLDWHPNGETLTLGTASGILRFYRFQDTWQGPWDIYTLTYYGGINELSYTLDGSKLAAVSDGQFDEYGGNVGIWDTKDNNRDFVLKYFIHDNAQGVDWMPDGNAFLTVGTGHYGGGIPGLRLNTVNNIYEYTKLSDLIQPFDISPDGSYLATYTFSRVDILTDFEDLRLNFLHGTKINDMAWSPDSQYLATAGVDGTLNIWDIPNNLGKSTPEPIQTLTAGVEITTITWSPDGTQLAAGDTDGTLWVWDLDGVELGTTTGFYKTILDYLAEGHISFQDDFSKQDPYDDNGGVWSDVTGVGSLWPEDGVRLIKKNEPVVEMIFPPFGHFNATDFAIQYDVSFDTGKPLDGFGLKLRASTNMASYYQFTFSYPSASWRLDQSTGAGSTLIESGETSFDPKDFNTFLIVAQQGNLAVFINDELIITKNDLEFSGVYNALVASARDGKSQVKLDNVIFWNLNGVDF